MPWMETGPMDQRMRLVAAHQAGTMTMAEVCRQAGVSRKTGYKWVQRYQVGGVSGLSDRPRARQTQAHRTPAAVVDQLLALKGRHPTWGPKKLVASARALVASGQAPDHGPIPAPSTVGALLQRHGLVRTRRRGRRPLPTSPLLHLADGPNQVWAADFKGAFAVGDGTVCAPLTITDTHSRYLLRCQALTRTHTGIVQALFEQTFRDYGLPAALRTDNGPPFASTGLAGLTPLAVWWLRLGIRLERITPGRPQQNGRHERLHRTLGEDALAPPATTIATQQRAFDRFVAEYNTRRPHEALGMATPAQVYGPSVRPYPSRLPELVYPRADHVRQVRPNGALRWQGREIQIAHALAGEPVGLHWVADGQWEVHFGPALLGILDEPAGRCFPVSARLRPAGAHGPQADTEG